MPRLRVVKNFNRRSIPSESIEPARKFFFAFEGNDTEPDYFKGLGKYRHELNFNKLIELIILERLDNDTLSHPKHILKGTTELLESGDYTYDSQLDEVWLVFDRDKQSLRLEQLDSILEECESLKYKVALTNPAFEFWLLCHFDDVNSFSTEEMLENEKISNRHSFISKKLTDILPKGYSKSKLRFMDFKDKIDVAIANSKKFATDFDILKAELGTNMGILIEELRK